MPTRLDPWAAAKLEADGTVVFHDDGFSAAGFSHPETGVYLLTLVNAMGPNEFMPDVNVWLDELAAAVFPLFVSRLLNNGTTVRIEAYVATIAIDVPFSVVVRRMSPA